jgi:hypothetical protein
VVDHAVRDLSTGIFLSLSGVTEALRTGLGLAVEEEVEVGQGVMLVDALIVPPKDSNLLPVAVEVDGPTHFFVNHDREPNGTTMLKRRLLDVAVAKGGLGAWVSVPWWEWRDRKGQQEEYLCELLKARGVDVPKYRRA